MAHFAKLNENNIVEEVIVINNEAMTDENGLEVEKRGIDVCRYMSNHDKWVQTSYNSSFRKNFAGIGYKYDETKDAFIPPNTIKGWVLNEETCVWEPPYPMPSDGEDYTWNEKNLNWEVLQIEE